jgi:hypothetical protein
MNAALGNFRINIYAVELIKFVFIYKERIKFAMMMSFILNTKRI